MNASRLPAERIAAAVEGAGLRPLSDEAAARFSAYFDLLERWNSKLNLTAIRDPEEVLRRHFLECIFCAQKLPLGIATLLDYGSGAGLPGIPIALCREEIQVTLAESQARKSSFLREAARSLGIGAEVHSGRVSAMTEERLFDAVTLRAVDRMREALREGAERVDGNGWLVLLVTAGQVGLPEGFVGSEMSLPASERGVLVLAQRRSVPRGTVG